MINLMCGLALHLAEVRGIDRVTAALVGEALGELPRPEPRHRVSHGRRSSAAPVSRIMRAALVAAVVLPPLLVGGGLLLRQAVHGPARRDQPPPAARVPQTPAEPVRVAALAPPPASIDFTSDAGAEAGHQPPPPVPTVPAESPPDARATRAPEPPVSPGRSGGGKGRRESTALKVAAATPMLPPMPPRAVSIRSAAPVARREPGKDEALLRPAEYGDLKAVQALLLGGASPEARDPAGFTPLMLAVIHGHPAIVDSLIAGGGRVNVQNRAGLTPLMLAAINNRAAVLRTLIDHGADKNARTRAGWTALTYAAWRGHAEIVRVLLARGADPNVTDREGWTILQYASWRAAEPVSNDDLPEPPAACGAADGAGARSRRSRRASSGTHPRARGALEPLRLEARLQDLARRALRQLGHDAHAAGILEGGEPLAAMGDEVGGRRGRVRAQRDEGGDLLAQRRMRHADDGGFRHGGMREEHGLHFAGQTDSRRAGSGPSCARRSSRSPRANAWRDRPS